MHLKLHSFSLHLLFISDLKVIVSKYLSNSQLYTAAHTRWANDLYRNHEKRPHLTAPLLKQSPAETCTDCFAFGFYSHHSI